MNKTSQNKMFDKTLFLKTLTALALLAFLTTCNMPTGPFEVACDVDELIDAINEANLVINHDTLELAPDCNYQLTEVFTVSSEGEGNGLPEITTPITINGNDATISRSFAIGIPDFRLIFISSTGNLTINDIRLERGRLISLHAEPSERSGGAIYNNGGTLTINHSSIGSNGVREKGGAIFNLDGNVVIQDTTLSWNRGHDGGAIASSGGEVRIFNHSILESNTATWDGGGIYMRRGRLAVTSSQIRRNTAGNNSGGIDGTDINLNLFRVTFNDNRAAYDGGALSVEDSTFIITDGEFLDNSARVDAGAMMIWGDAGIIQTTLFDGNSARHSGGAITGGGELEILESTFQNNQSGRWGGGLELYGDLIIRDTTVTSNSSNWEWGGGLFINGDMVMENCQITHNVALLNGGGVYLEDGFHTIQNSTIERNMSGSDGGGLYTETDVSITSSTFANNSARRGGGLASLGGTVVITNSTFSTNTVSDLGGGILILGPVVDLSVHINNSTIAFNKAITGGGIELSGGKLFIKNSIVANSLLGNDCHESSGDFVAEGNNLDSDDSCPSFMFHEDPRLDGLADNGGLTHTHALLADSPAINAASDCITSAGDTLIQDQRAIPRPFEAQCDIGAYEYRGYDPSKMTPTATSPPTSTFTVTPESSSSPMATARQNATCRLGPGRIYEEQDYLLEGQTAQVTGRTQDGTWLQIEGPRWGRLCWIWVDLLEVVGDTDQVPVKKPPPTPTLTPTLTPTPTPEPPKGCWWQSPNMNQPECKVPCPNDQYSGAECKP